MTAEQRLQALGITLAPATAPAGSYAPAVCTGDLLFLSAKGPLPVDGQLPKGRIGREFSADQGYAFARSACLDLLFVAKAIERIGDHAKNIAEFIIYVVKGLDVRHTSLDDVEAIAK